MLDQPASREPAPKGLALAFASIAAMALLAMAVLLPPWPLASTIDGVGIAEQFWLGSLAKQVSGFILLGIFVIAATLSLRKRIRLMAFGDFPGWRFVHAFVGAAALLGFFAHSGFRFGSNLNAWLALSFAGIAGAGALAGLAIAAEHRMQSAQAAAHLRSASFWLHVAFLWPLPLLLAFHILSVYYY